MLRYYDNITIPGITASGTDDGSGSWTSAIDISSVLASAGAEIVSSPGALIIRIHNKSSSNRWSGVRRAGMTPEVFEDFENRRSIDYLITLDGDSSLEFYCENPASVDFYIVGLFGEGWTWYQPGGRPTVTGTGSNWSSVTMAGILPNASVFLSYGAGYWHPTGASTDASNQLGGNIRLVKLDSNSSVDMNTGQDSEIIGYTTTEVEWEPWLEKAWTPTVDSAYHDVPFNIGAGRVGYFAVDKLAISIDYYFQPKGSSANIDPNHAKADEYSVSGADENGVVQYAIESGSAVSAVYLLATINGVESGPPAPSINPTGTDKAVTVGETHSIEFAGITSNPASIAIVHGETVTVQSDFVYTPDAEDATKGTATFTGTLGNLPYGTSGYSYLVTCADESEITFDIDSLSPAAGRDYVVAVDPVSDETGILYVWDEGGPVTGDQVSWPVLVDGVTTTIRPDFTFYGETETTFPDSITLDIDYWDSVTSTRYYRSVEVAFGEDGEGTVIGVTARGFTVEGFTVRGFTARGF